MAWCTSSTKPRPANSTKPERSRPKSALRRWASIPQLTTCFWTPQTSRRPLPLPWNTRIPGQRRCRGRFVCWFTASNEPSPPRQERLVFIAFVRQSLSPEEGQGSAQPVHQGNRRRQQHRDRVNAGRESHAPLRRQLRTQLLGHTFAQVAETYRDE